ncbi:MAG: hypothetical protein WCK67_09395 [bacterium]
MADNEIKLAYGAAFSSQGFGYIGAVLVSDSKGFPTEFRYTDPIVPTKIQQVLYGNGLEKYIKIDVILDSLIKAMSSFSKILLVQDEDLLNYKSENVTVIRISATKIPPLSQVGEVSNVKRNEYLIQTSNASSPIRVQFADHFACEGEKFNSAIETLIEAGNYMSVEEPLGRVYKTLELISAQEI